MPSKTYVLIETHKSTVPVFLRINQHQRVRLGTPPVDAPAIKHTFTDTNGKYKTHRLKMRCNSIDQEDQIKTFGIPANEPFTEAEREAVKFRFGVNVVSNTTVQNYMENNPEYEGFEFDRQPDDPKPKYRIFEKYKEIEEEVDLMMKQVEVAGRILKMELKTAQELHILVHGSFNQPSNNIKEVQKNLIEFCNAAQEDVLDAILDKTQALETKAAKQEAKKEQKQGELIEKTENDEINILIANAEKAKLIDFTVNQNQVSRKQHNKWVNVQSISSDIEKNERWKIFATFLKSPEGTLLAEDLQKELDAMNKK